MIKRNSRILPYLLCSFVMLLLIPLRAVAQTEAAAKKNTSTAVKNSGSKPSHDDVKGKAVVPGKLANLIPIDVPIKSFAQEGDVHGKMIDLKTKVYWYDGGINGARNIRLDGVLTNRSQYNSFYAVHVAFFNADGDMICSGSTAGGPVEPGKSGNCNVEMNVPKGSELLIKGYQLSFYDGPQSVSKL